MEGVPLSRLIALADGAGQLDEVGEAGLIFRNVRDRRLALEGQVVVCMIPVCGLQLGQIFVR
jgi:hypothetical protein